MPWSDNSDTGAKPGQKPGAKPGPKQGPWGAAPPSAGGLGEDRDGQGGPRGDGPRGGGPRRPGTPPSPPDDLIALWRRVRKRLEDEFGVMGPGLWRRLLPALGAAIVGLWLLSGFYGVAADQEGVVTTFGAYSRTAGPGWHYHLPAPIERVEQIPVTTVNQTNIGSKAGDLPKESLMLTGDENIVDVAFSVQWRIDNPGRYLFDIKDQDDTIKAVAESAMREVVGRSTLTDVIATGKAKVEAQSAALMQKILDSYGAGVSVVSVQIASANPPAEVAPDFQAVQSASQDAQSAINQATAYSNKVVNEAKGTAAQKELAAQGYRQQVIAEAQGEADAFNSVDAQYRRAPGVTRERLYLETMERVLGKSAKVIVDAKGASAPIILPPDVFRPRSADASQPPQPAPDVTVQPAQPAQSAEPAQPAQGGASQ
jgi:membrane protease subunit HflK